MPIQHEETRQARLTQSSHYLLKHLGLRDAHIVFVTTLAADDEVAGKYFYQRGRKHFPVPESSVDALTRAGFIARERGSPVPIYRITKKGGEYLSTSLRNDT